MKTISQNNVIQEITAILQAEFECAESLKATSVEIQRLLESGKFEQMSERLHARGEVLELMVTLDKQWSTLAKGYLGKMNGDEWESAFQTGQKLRSVMQSLTSDNAGLEKQLQHKYKETSETLQTLFVGKKVMKNYSESMYGKASPQYTDATS